MKTVIYYFSGTGNSLAIAKGLTKELPGQVELLPIIEGEKQVEFDGELLGIVYPVYNQSLPNIVRMFLKKFIFMRDKPTTYIFSVATCNGEPGHSLFTVNRLLKRKGKSLDLGFAVDMPGNALMNPPEIQRERLAKAQTKLPLIAQAIIRRQHGVIEGSNAIGTYLKGKVLDIIAKPLIRPAKRFVRNNCKHCGVCTRVCPIKNITLDSQRRPVWGNRCEYCLACFHWCPEQAVELHKHSIGKPRYHHPEITADEIIVL
jgi:ferredoxin